MNKLNLHARVFLALVRRQVCKARELYTHVFVDGMFQAVAQYILICYFFPVMGMPIALIAPMYLGGMIAMVFSTGFTAAFNQQFDLKGNRIIDYHLTLALTPAWLMSVYILRGMMNMVVVTIPFLFLSLYIFPHFALPIEIKWMSLMGIYSLMLLCFSVWYQAASFAYEFQWFLNNLWPRRLFFVFLFGCLFIPFHAIYKVSPYLAYAFLWNPMTYCAEGLCASLFPADPYLSVTVCLAVLGMYTLVGMKALSSGMRKRLDPVL